MRNMVTGALIDFSHIKVGARLQSDIMATSSSSSEIVSLSVKAR